MKRKLAPRFALGANARTFAAAEIALSKITEMTMTKFFLIAIGVLALAAAVFALLFIWQKRKAKDSRELYEAAKQRNLELSETLGKLQAAEIVRSEERKNADKKIADARSGSARERFDRIVGGMRERGAN
ncbi:MAG: hypothetical protein NC548_53990 [Lachnospiraceae bacterium]|nr:hypothetical protein [Lachnospiraceae bacterium]